MIRAAAILSLLAAGCIDGVAVTEPDAGDHDLPDAAARFKEVNCAPAVQMGGDPERGQIVECTFRLEGFVAPGPALSCTDASGLEFDCATAGGPSGVELWLHDQDLEPLDVGLVRIVAGQRLDAAGEDNLVLVARSGSNRAEHTLRIVTRPVDPDPSAPHLRVACDGVVSGTATTRLHEPLSCLVYVDDPDPGDDLRFEAWWVGHPHLAPVGGSPVEVWTWEPIRAEDVGVQSFKFTVIADPFARFDLDVTVLEAN